MRTNFNIGLSLRLLVVALSFHILLGCAASLPVESPICVPLRPVLENISVLEQRAMKAASPAGFLGVARNDAKLKSQVRLLESVILLHDEPLGSCD